MNHVDKYCINPSIVEDLFVFLIAKYHRIRTRKNTPFAVVAHVCLPNPTSAKTMLLHNGEFCDGFVRKQCSTKVAYNVLVSGLLEISDESNRYIIFFCDSLENIGFLMTGMQVLNPFL
jgi:hypothetical protein